MKRMQQALAILSVIILSTSSALAGDRHDKGRDKGDRSHRDSFVHRDWDDSKRHRVKRSHDRGRHYPHRASHRRDHSGRHVWRRGVRRFDDRYMRHRCDDVRARRPGIRHRDARRHDHRYGRPFASWPSRRGASVDLWFDGYRVRYTDYAGW